MASLVVASAITILEIGASTIGPAATGGRSTTIGINGTTIGTITASIIITTGITAVGTITGAMVGTRRWLGEPWVGGWARCTAAATEARPTTTRITRHLRRCLTTIRSR